MILSISGINSAGQNHGFQKTLLVYILLSSTAIAVDKIYAIFGHGVGSVAMSRMFLYPLLGGSLFYVLVFLLVPDVGNAAGFRLFYNTYNSGIAILTVDGFLKGILEIAGTSSAYTAAFNAAGWVFAVAGLVILIVSVIKNKAAGKTPEASPGNIK